MGRKERSSPPDEKVTVNLGPIDIGRIDLLVEEGFYSNRTDVIRSAVRQLLDGHDESIKEAVKRQTLAVGVVLWTRAGLEEARKKGERLDARVLGVLRVASDVSPELADDVIESVRVLGHFSASSEVRTRLAPKIVRG